MEARIARLESDVAHIKADIAEIKADFRDFRVKVKADFAEVRHDFRLLWGALFAITLGLAGLLAKGFGWV